MQSFPDHVSQALVAKAATCFSWHEDLDASMRWRETGHGQDHHRLQAMRTTARRHPGHENTKMRGVRGDHQDSLGQARKARARQGGTRRRHEHGQEARAIGHDCRDQAPCHRATKRCVKLKFKLLVQIFLDSF